MRSCAIRNTLPSLAVPAPRRDRQGLENHVTDSNQLSSERAGPIALSDRERAVLDFESRHWSADPPITAGQKESAIRQELGISPSRYYQLLNGLLDTERALAHHPVMVNRLRAAREASRAARQSTSGY